MASAYGSRFSGSLVLLSRPLLASWAPPHDARAEWGLGATQPAAVAPPAPGSVTSDLVGSAARLFRQFCCRGTPVGARARFRHLRRRGNLLRGARGLSPVFGGGMVAYNTSDQVQAELLRAGVEPNPGER